MKNKTTEPKQEGTWCIFVYSIKNQFFTLQKIFEKSWEHTKDTTVVDIEEAHNQAHWEKFWWCLQKYSVDGHMLLASSQCIHFQTVVFISTNHRCFTLKRVCAVPAPLHILYKFDRLSEPRSRGHQDQLFTFCGRLYGACILWTGSSKSTW